MTDQTDQFRGTPPPIPAPPPIPVPGTGVPAAPASPPDAAPPSGPAAEAPARPSLIPDGPLAPPPPPAASPKAPASEPAAPATPAAGQVCGNCGKWSGGWNARICPHCHADLRTGKSSGGGLDLRRLVSASNLLLILGGVLLFGIYMWIGWYLAAELRSFNQDTLARTSQAYAVLRSADPHLGAIGFVWQPVLSLLQLPLVLIDGLARDGLTGSVVSAAFGVIGILAFWLLAGTVGLSGGWRVLATVTFAIQPLWILYAATGMSETLFITLVMLQAWALLEWLETREYRWIIIAGSLAGIGFLTRYEAIPITMAMAIWIGLVDSRNASRLQGSLLGFLAPSVYTFILWIWFNFSFTGDPLFFLRSDYSNAALVAAERAAGNLGDQPLLQGLADVALSSLAMAPVLLIALPWAALILWGRSNLPAILLAAVGGSVIAFQVYLEVVGQSFGFFRFYMILLPIGPLLLGALLARSSAEWVRGLAAPLTSIALLIAIPTTIWGSSIWGFQEKILYQYFAFGVPIEDRYASERRLTEFLDTLDGRIALDVSAAYATQLGVRRPENLSIATDQDFIGQVTQAPSPDSVIAYVAVPDPQRQINVPGDSINAMWPNLYAQGAPWAELVYDDQVGTGWRVYRVIKQQRPDTEPVFTPGGQRLPDPTPVPGGAVR